jgi:hypothetical protein
MLPESGVCSRKVGPATLTCDDLRRVTDLGRESMMQSVKSSGDAELDDQLYASPHKQVSKGFI